MTAPTCPECQQPLARNHATRELRCLTHQCPVAEAGPLAKVRIFPNSVEPCTADTEPVE